MMNDYNDLIEQKIFEFAKNDRGVPNFVDEAIDNAISRISQVIMFSIK